MPDAPRIETRRLVLRMPRRADFDALAPTLMSARARFVGGPFTLEGAWKDFCTDVAGWALSGTGSWAIEMRATGVFCGVVVVSDRPDFPEREMGWILVPEAEGQGIAEEAARAVRIHVLEVWGWPTLVSYIAPGNARSVALAERLGATRDAAVAGPDADCLVFRHPAPRSAGAAPTETEIRA